MIEFVKTARKDHRIYMDVGTAEAHGGTQVDMSDIYIRGNQRLFEALKTSEMSCDTLRYMIEADADHSEGAWKRRFPEAYRWLMASETE